MLIDEISPDSGVLYFMQGPHHEEENVIRIGKTTVANFYRRLVVYNTAYPYRDAKIVALRLFPTKSEAEAEEKERLSSFERVRRNCDWVHYNQDVKTYIRQNCITDEKRIEQFEQIAHEARKEQDKKKRNKKS